MHTARIKVIACPEDGRIIVEAHASPADELGSYGAYYELRVGPRAGLHVSPIYWRQAYSNGGDSSAESTDVETAPGDAD